VSGQDSGEVLDVRAPLERREDQIASGRARLVKLQLLVAAGRPRVRVAELDVLRDRAARCAAQWRLAGRRLRVALDRAGAPAAAGRELATLDDELQRLAGDAGRVTAAARADLLPAGALSAPMLQNPPSPT